MSPCARICYRIINDPWLVAGNCRAAKAGIASDFLEFTAKAGHEDNPVSVDKTDHGNRHFEERGHERCYLIECGNRRRVEDVIAF